MTASRQDSWSSCAPWRRSMTLKATWLLLLSLMADTIHSLDINNCRVALGMESGEIPDSAISASSSYDPTSVGAANARIRTETKGGAWCPKKEVSKEVYEYLQISFEHLMVISLVETQGRFGNGQGREFADQYLLEYQREDNGKWFRFRNRRGQEIIAGNTNTYMAELRELDPPVIGKRLRFIPYSAHPHTVCMRVEVYGCPWTDGLVSYSMRQGETRGNEVDLHDMTYDGEVNNKQLSGGLGQLTDGQEGQWNFRLTQSATGKKGYEWIGWRNESLRTQPVQLIFKFDQVRNFSSLRLHANNMFSKDVRVFKEAKIWFSIGGQYYRRKPLIFKYMRDTLIEYARPIIIGLENHVARYLKVQLYFDARWIMLDEVKFTSVPVDGNFSTEAPPPARPGVSDRPSVIHVDIPKTNDPGDVRTTPSEPPYNGKKRPSGLDDEYIGVIIGGLATFVLFVFIVVLILVLRQRRRKFNNNHKAMKPSDTSRITVDLNELQYATHVNGNVTTANGKINNGNLYNFVSSGDYETEDEQKKELEEIQQRKLPELPRSPAHSDILSSRDYAVPDVTKSALYAPPPPYAVTPKHYGIQGRPTPPMHRLAAAPTQGPLYAASGENAPPTQHPQRRLCSDIINTSYAASDSGCDPGEGGAMPNIQGVGGGTVYSPNSENFLWQEEIQLLEFPRENLKFIEQLGEGQFGEVHLCEAINLSEFLGDDFLLNRTSGGACSMRVAVKVLRTNASESAKNDFHKEVKLMARLKDPNIVRVLGVCTRQDPLCYVVEYMKHGDLHQFLRRHVPEGSTMAKRKHRHISNGCLVYMACQIASGMKYLESLNLVHRDLATRNVLVGHQYTVKVSDFGMSRSLYSSDYYRIEGKAVLPIRWMAWESVLLGKFSCKSDVWSFAITLWEILNFCREQPFKELEDEEVIDNCGHFYRGLGSHVLLPCPVTCPREIYDLMCECWNREESLRPSFREIHMFLMRKNMGFDPREERVYAVPGTGTFPRITKEMSPVLPV